MTALSQSVVARTLDVAEIVYVDRDITRWWNQRKASGDTATFTGHYWRNRSNSGQEAGPFKTFSAAVRDAYYVLVLNAEPPSVLSPTKRGKGSKDHVNGSVARHKSRGRQGQTALIAGGAS